MWTNIYQWTILYVDLIISQNLYGEERPKSMIKFSIITNPGVEYFYSMLIYDDKKW